MSTPDAAAPTPTTLAELPRNRECDFFCYIAERELLLTRSGRPYLRVTVRDATRSITFPIWRESPWWDLCDQHFHAGVFCKVRAIYRESAHGPQFEFRKIRPATAEDSPQGFDPQRFLPPSRGDNAAFFTAVREIAEKEITDEPLRRMTLQLLDSHREAWMQQAGGRWHHAYPGGLIEHTYFALRGAMRLWETYAFADGELASELNRDVTIAGAILHDVGRIQELRVTPVGVEMSDAGQLLGHPALGRDLVRDAAIACGVDEELRLRLEHVLLSHHARPDYGSPAPPMTLEALLVHLADDADARLIAAWEALQAEPTSHWTSKRNPTGQKWRRGASREPENPARPS